MLLHVDGLPSGQLTVCCWTSHLLWLNQRTKWAIFNSYVKLPEGTFLGICEGLSHQVLDLIPKSWCFAISKNPHGKWLNLHISSPLFISYVMSQKSVVIYVLKPWSYALNPQFWDVSKTPHFCLGAYPEAGSMANSDVRLGQRRAPELEWLVSSPMAL